MEPVYQQFIPQHKYSRRELDAIIAECAGMANDYATHYPEIHGHLERYLAIREGIWEHSKTIPRDDSEGFHNAIAVAVGGGCFVLRPDVALYLMRVDIALYIRCIAGYLTGPNLDPTRLHLPNCLIVTFLTAVGRDLCRHDHFTYIRGLLDDLPINSLYKDDIWDVVVAQLTNSPVPPRRAH